MRLRMCVHCAALSTLFKLSVEPVKMERNMEWQGEEDCLLRVCTGMLSLSGLSVLRCKAGAQQRRSGGGERSRAAGCRRRFLLFFLFLATLPGALV